MLDEFRLAFARLREDDVTASRRHGLGAGWPRAGRCSPRRSTTGCAGRYAADGPVAPGLHHRRARRSRSTVDGEVVLADGRPTRVDPDEIRAKAAEAAPQAGRPTVDPSDPTVSDTTERR